MGGSSPVIDPHGNVYVASADGYDLGAGQPYDDSDAVLELSPTMRLKSIFYPKDWQQLSADDLDLGTGDPALVHGFVLQVGKTDIGYLLRQGHLGGSEGEVTSRSVCSGNPDGGHAVKRSVVYVPCPNGVTAIKVLAKAPYLKQLWTDNDGAAGAPIIADGLIWTIGSDNAVHGLNPANGKVVVSIPFGGSANHFPTPSVGDGLLLLPHRPGPRLQGSGRAAAATPGEVRRAWVPLMLIEPDSGRRRRSRPGTGAVRWCRSLGPARTDRQLVLAPSTARRSPRAVRL
jgi:outer membrane protein assembly factor BamB